MANQDPNPDKHDPNVEEPGDTGAADIVGRTGEEMPQKSHDGLEADDRGRPLDGGDEPDAVDAEDGTPDPPTDRVH